jgi:hypothetical protein
LRTRRYNTNKLHSNDQRRTNIVSEKIRNVDAETEEKMDANVDLFEQNVPDPTAPDYFLVKNSEGMTEEEIVDRALTYKPF